MYHVSITISLIDRYLGKNVYILEIEYTKMTLVFIGSTNIENVFLIGSSSFSHG